MYDHRKVVEIAELCWEDAVESLGLIEVLEAGNSNGATAALNQGGAGRAAAHVQRSLFTRLHTIVSRHYLPPHKKDLTAARAFKLLEDPTVRANVVRDGDAAALSEAEKCWKSCVGSPDLGAYIHLRNKKIAHLGEPDPDISVPIYRQVFSIARNTAACFEQLAFGSGIIDGIMLDEHLPTERESAAAYWKPWVTPS